MFFIAKLIISLLLSQNAIAKTKIFIPKRDVENLRFISHSGEVSYFQKRDGSLYMTKHFKITRIIEGSKEHTQYFIQSYGDQLLILQDENFFNQLNMRKNLKIYISKIGSTKANFYQNGRLPRLHLNQQWISYFNAESRTIFLNFLPVKERKFQIKLDNPNFPYFRPDGILLDQENFIYTDIGSDGIVKLVKFNLINKAFDLIHKASSVNAKLELCKEGKRVYVAQFQVNADKSDNIIYGLDPVKVKLQKIYTSTDYHLGSLVCSDKTPNQVYFVKSRSKEHTMQKEFITDVLQLNIQNKKSKFISNLGKIGHLVMIDGRMITNLGEKYYVVTPE